MPAIRRLICCTPAVKNLEQIEAKPGMPLGIRRAAQFVSRALTIRSGDALFVCSDGVFEALNEDGDLFSMERLTQVLQSVCHAEPVALVETVKDAVDAFAGDQRRTT